MVKNIHKSNLPNWFLGFSQNLEVCNQCHFSVLETYLLIFNFDFHILMFTYNKLHKKITYLLDFFLENMDFQIFKKLVYTF